MIPPRRGACPSLAAPMQTGDGLLARIIPVGGIAPATFVGLCAAAQRHGNGVIEVTQRGNIQVRGLSAASAPVFADAFAALGVANAAGVAMTTNALAGLDPSEIIDGNFLLNQLGDALDATDLPSALDAKFSVIVDGGGALHLDALKADIRLRALGHPCGVLWHLAVAGSAEESTPLGAVAPEHAAGAVLRLLNVVAVRGPTVRARDVLPGEGVGAFCAAIVNDLMDVPPPQRPAAEPVGIHPLRGESVALGLGLTFGCDADTLIELAKAGADAGSTEIRPAPGRALLIVGLTADAAGGLRTFAEHLGFVVQADDPRRYIAACAGAPVCGSGEIATRVLAPLIAEAASLFDGSLQVHVAGCRKGCAHAGRAELTIVGLQGRCGVVINGSPLDLPAAEVSPRALPESFRRLAGEVEAARVAGERTADVLMRFGNARIAAVLRGESVRA